MGIHFLHFGETVGIHFLHFGENESPYYGKNIGKTQIFAAFRVFFNIISKRSMLLAKPKKLNHEKYCIART